MSKKSGPISTWSDLVCEQGEMSGALGGRVVRSKWCVAATIMTAEVHYCLDLVNGNARTILHLDNSYSASACVGKSITGVIPLPVTLFLLSQQILCGSTWFNFAVPKDTYFMTCDHTENLLLGKKLSF